MRKNYASIVEKGNEVIKKIIGAVSFRAFADEGDSAGDEPSNTDEGADKGKDEKKAPTINYEDLIAKARREEKEKQYKTIEKLKGQIDTLTEQHNNDLLKVAELEKDLKEANAKLTKAGSSDSEEVKTLKDTVKTLEKDKEDLEKKVKGYEDNKPASREEIEAEVRKELEAEYEVKTYKAEKMAELKDDILVPELVMGSTKEEIDASIESALERSNKIKESLGITKKEKKDKRTPKSPSNPSLGKVQDKEITAEYLASLDVSSKEYAEVRKQLGLR